MEEKKEDLCVWEMSLIPAPPPTILQLQHQGIPQLQHILQQLILTTTWNSEEEAPALEMYLLEIGMDILDPFVMIIFVSQKLT